MVVIINLMNQATAPLHILHSYEIMLASDSEKTDMTRTYIIWFMEFNLFSDQETLEIDFFGTSSKNKTKDKWMKMILLKNGMCSFMSIKPRSVKS